jgi:hypothetical protein
MIRSAFLRLLEAGKGTASSSAPLTVRALVAVSRPTVCADALTSMDS